MERFIPKTKKLIFLNYSNMLHFNHFYLIPFVLLALFIQTEQVALPGCPSKCGNLTIPFPFGLNSECCSEDSFLIMCNTSFEPPKPFLRQGSAEEEVVSISLDGKMKIFNSSSSGFGEVVIHWAAGKAACHVAQWNNGSRYACQSMHSVCEDSSDGGGHTCRCLPGYQGNPYLLDGCQDINECTVDSNPCEEGAVCINLEGSLKCYCPIGSVGDGRKDGTGCSHTQPDITILMHMSSSSFFLPIGIFAVAPLLATTYIVWTDRVKKLQKLREDQFEQNGGNLLLRKLSSRGRDRQRQQLSIYTVQDMISITKDYSDKIVMQRCCRGGTFYRGTLPDDDNTEVAVMMVERVPQSQIKQFVDQLIFLSQHHNKNVVRVLGCCLETHSPLIVYELHGDGVATLVDFTRDGARFSCEMRVKAAAAVATGLAYLNCSRTAFVLGNLCSANIVVDSSFDAKIFYAAGSNLIPRDYDVENYVYEDPKLSSSGRLNNKSDVYSFGVVLVELLTGGRAVARVRRERDRSMALNFVSMAKAGRLREILDDEMVGEADGEIVREIAALAQRCLNVEPSKRPNMKQVEAKLTKFIMPRE